MQKCPHAGTSPKQRNRNKFDKLGRGRKLSFPAELFGNYDPGSMSETWMVLLCASSIPVTFTL